VTTKPVIIKVTVDQFRRGFEHMDLETKLQTATELFMISERTTALESHLKDAEEVLITILDLSLDISVLKEINTYFEKHKEPLK
jgi:hypothetical protein